MLSCTAITAVNFRTFSSSHNGPHSHFPQASPPVLGSHSYKTQSSWESPGSLVFDTPCLQCRRHRFDWETRIPHGAWPPQKDNFLCTSLDLPVPDISYKWNHTMCDLCNWLPVSLMFSRFIHVIHASDLIPFYWWTIFHCMVTPQFIYPFISLWTFGLFLLLAFMNVNIHVSFCVNVCFHFSRIYIS